MRDHSEVARGDGFRMSRALTAGFSATALMLGVFVLSYSVLQMLGGLLWDQDRGVLGQWIYNLVNNPLVNAAQGQFYVTMLLHLAIGIGLAFVYAWFVEPRLTGSGWKRGMLFALIPWVLSLLVFFPIAGAGLLGLRLDAGPLPLLGNLVLHLFYGASLGLIYGAVGDVLTERTDSPENDARERLAMRATQRGAAVGIVGGLVVGALIGAVTSGFAPAGSELFSFPPGWIFATATLAGGALGGLLGSLMSLPTAVVPRVPRAPVVR